MDRTDWAVANKRSRIKLSCRYENNPRDLILYLFSRAGRRKTKMPYQVQQITAGKGPPVCVGKDDTISRALSLMIEHDFSQLPVIKKISDSTDRDIPEGMITYEGVVRGMRNFKAKIDNLRVRDVMVAAPIYSLEDDLFDILDHLKDINAVLVSEDTGAGPNLVGIVTSYDTIEYFRDRTEDLMRVEDIEMMVKEFIKAAYVDDHDEFDAASLNAVVTKTTSSKNKNGERQKEKTFDDLNLSEYTMLLVLKETWPFFEPIFRVQRSFVIELLNGIREIRNALAHFHGDLSAEQRDKLKFGASWLSRCREEYHAHKTREESERLMQLFKKHEPTRKPKTVREELGQYDLNGATLPGSTDFAVTESATNGGRYAALADWLQSRPGRVDKVQLTLNQIEEIIAANLPASARTHLAWWAHKVVGP